MAESVAGLVCVGVAVLALLSTRLWGWEFSVLAAMGLAVTGLRVLCAPLMVAMGIGHATRMAAHAGASAPAAEAVPLAA
jgi:hypothetical protein